LAILGSKSSRLAGLGYLTLYNLIFISPLVVIHLAVTNRHTAERLRTWQVAHARRFKIAAGAVIAALGALVLWLL
jgi:cytochrome c biogenesis protein CcdA